MRARIGGLLLLLLLLPGWLIAAESLPQLRAKSEGGDSAARYEFARRVFEQGEGSSADREKAFPWLETAAQQGHAPALELAATLRLFDESDHFDFARGLDYLRRAESANPASPRVKVLRGLLHHQGRGRDYDPELGLKLIAEAADAGDVLAVELQREVKAGKGLAEALAYEAPPPPLLRAAENGDAEAQLRLAQLYLAGHIVHREQRNPGFGWRERAAEGGSAAAQAALGEALRSGAGYPKDAARALRWLTRAAAQNHARAAYLAGLMHRNGEGTAKNEPEAARLFSIAVEHGSTDAEAPFGIMLVEGRGIVPDPQRGFTLLNRAEQRNNAEARLYLLAQGFAGKYQPQDASQLARLLEQGVRDKQTRAKSVLGIRLHRGDGLKQDIGRAVPLLRAAMNEGDLDATREYLDYLGKNFARLEELRKQGRPVDGDLLRQVEDYQAALVLYGRNGGREERLEAAKTLSDNWTSPATQKYRDRHGDRISKPLQSTVALVRLYRREGGKDTAALRWLAQIEKHYVDLKWKNMNGDTARKLFDEAEAELRKFKRPER